MQPCASVCSSYRNNKIHLRVWITQLEGGDFLKSATGEHDRASGTARVHRFILCH